MFVARSSSLKHDVGLNKALRVARQLCIGYEDLASIVGVDQSTLYRWRHDATTPRKSMRVPLRQFAEMHLLLRRLFDGPDLAREWIHHALPESFGGKTTPIAMLRSGRIDRVLSLLERLAAGG